MIQTWMADHNEMQEHIAIKHTKTHCYDKAKKKELISKDLRRNGSCSWAMAVGAMKLGWSMAASTFKTIFASFGSSGWRSQSDSDCCCFEVRPEYYKVGSTFSDLRLHTGCLLPLGCLGQNTGQPTRPMLQKTMKRLEDISHSP